MEEEEEDHSKTPRPRMSLIHDSVVIEDKVYVVDSWNKSFFYSPKQCKWGRGNHDSKPKNKKDWCMIDNLLYSCGQGGCKYWCEPHELDRCDAEGMNWTGVRIFDLQRLKYRFYWWEDGKSVPKRSRFTSQCQINQLCSEYCHLLGCSRRCSWLPDLADLVS